MVRQMTKFLTLLVLVLAVCATVYAQGPSDTNNTGGDPPVPTPPTVTPRPLVPTPPPTPPQPVTPPTPTTKKTPGSVASKDGSDNGAAPNGAQPKTPKPTPTTRAPGVTPPAAAAAATPPPAITTVSPAILLDRTVKSEYGTRSPAANETTTATNPESTASKMGSWLVPAVIGAVIVSALIFMTFFMRNRRDGDEEDHQTPRRSDAFFEHPKTNTHQAPHVPVLGDHVKSKSSSEKDHSSMRTVAVGGAHHSPRANRVASTDSSPGFPMHKQKTVEGSSVIF